MSFESENIFELFQQFLSEFGNEFETVEEAMNEFMNHYQIKFEETLDMASLPEIQSMELVDAAIYSTNKITRRKLLEEALELWPENIDAKVELIDEENASYYLRALEDIYRVEKAKRHSLPLMGWANVGERSYWRLNQTLAITYAAFSMLIKAEEIYKYILENDPQDNLGVRYDLMAIYCRLYDWGNAQALYHEIADANTDDRMILPLLVLAIITGRQEAACHLFIDLHNCNPELDLIIDEEEDQFDFDFMMDMSQAEKIEPNTSESLSMAFAPLMPIIATSNFVYSWFVTHFQMDDPALFLSNKIISLSFGQGNRQPKLESNIFTGLSQKQISACHLQGLLDLGDFAKVTSSEFLKLPQIGPATLRKLRENGVKFLDDKA